MAGSHPEGQGGAVLLAVGETLRSRHGWICPRGSVVYYYAEGRHHCGICSGWGGVWAGYRYLVDLADKRVGAGPAASQ
jgi:hypothetical protein